MEPVVVVGYDESPSSERALDEAAAASEGRSAALTVVHAYRALPPAAPPFEMPDADRRLHESALPVAQRAADRIRAAHEGLTVEARALPGRPADVLAEAAADAELLVVGHRGRGGFPGLGLGSVALRTVTRSPVPTLVVRGEPHRPRRVVLAAVDVGDPDPGSARILDSAFAEAARRGAELRAISAWEVLWPRVHLGDAGDLRRAADRARERADAALARLVRPWRDRYPDLVAEHKLADGDPVTVLVGATSYADLVVAGARRRDDRGVRLGPVAHTLLRHADCSVLVVPHD